MLSEFEGMTIQRICEWANRLGVCEFEVAEKFDEEIVKAKGGKKVSLELHIGQYSTSVPIHGGMAHVSVYWQDNREGYSGGGSPFDTWEALERAVVNGAYRLGLATGQLRMF